MLFVFAVVNGDGFMVEGIELRITSREQSGTVGEASRINELSTNLLGRQEQRSIEVIKKILRNALERFIYS